MDLHQLFINKWKTNKYYSKDFIKIPESPPTSPPPLLKTYLISQETPRNKKNLINMQSPKNVKKNIEENIEKKVKETVVKNAEENVIEIVKENDGENVKKNIKENKNDIKNENAIKTNNNAANGRGIVPADNIKAKKNEKLPKSNKKNFFNKKSDVKHEIHKAQIKSNHKAPNLEENRKIFIPVTNSANSTSLNIEKTQIKNNLNEKEEVKLPNLSSITGDELLERKRTLRKTVPREPRRVINSTFYSTPEEIADNVVSSVSSTINTLVDDNLTNVKSHADELIDNAFNIFENQPDENKNITDNSKSNVSNINVINSRNNFNLHKINYSKFIRKMVKILLNLSDKVIDQDNLIYELISDNLKHISFKDENIIPENFTGVAFLIEDSELYIVNVSENQIKYLDDPITALEFKKNKLYGALIDEIEKNNNVIPIIFDGYEDLKRFENLSVFASKKLRFHGMK